MSRGLTPGHESHCHCEEPRAHARGDEAIWMCRGTPRTMKVEVAEGVAWSGYLGGRPQGPPLHKKRQLPRECPCAFGCRGGACPRPLLRPICRYEPGRVIQGTFWTILMSRGLTLDDESREPGVAGCVVRGAF